MAHNSSNGCENSQFVPLLCVDSSIPADVEEVRGDSREDKRKGPRPKKLTDKDYEEMPTENLDWEKISAEEKERMKDWARRKEKELLEQASELQFRLVSFALHWYTFFSFVVFLVYRLQCIDTVGWAAGRASGL